MTTTNSALATATAVLLMASTASASIQRAPASDPMAVANPSAIPTTPKTVSCNRILNPIKSQKLMIQLLHSSCFQEILNPLHTYTQADIARKDMWATNMINNFMLGNATSRYEIWRAAKTLEHAPNSRYAAELKKALGEGVSFNVLEPTVQVSTTWNPSLTLLFLLGNEELEATGMDLRREAHKPANKAEAVGMWHLADQMSRTALYIERKSEAQPGLITDTNPNSGATMLPNSSSGPGNNQSKKIATGGIRHE